MKYLLPILFAFCFISCQRHSDNWEKICDIENYIESKPDSVLTVLEAIDINSLSSDEERAKYALYMSMALDKNYIDKTDFQVLQPAIDYFEDYGSDTDKLRTFYYQGRIYQNGGDDESAMMAFVKATEYKNRAYDAYTIARCYYAQATLYYKLYDHKAIIETSKQAFEYYTQANSFNNQMKCLLRIINAYCHLKEKSQADTYIDKCQSLLGKVDETIEGSYYATMLSYCINFSLDNLLYKILDDYISSIDKSLIDWASVSYAYLILKDYDNAQRAMERYRKPEDDSIKEAKYYSMWADIYKAQKDYKNALAAYEQYLALSDSLDLIIFEQDTKFIEERHQLEMATIKEQEKKKQIIAFFVTIVSILVLIAIWINSRLRLSRMEKLVAEKEAERYKLLYAQMEDERDNLNALLRQNEELDPKVLNAVARRLELLNKFFTAYITDNSDIDRKASKEMEELLEDKEKFMDSNRLAYAGSHPKFIKYLADKGLTEWEINYCCLYALGLKGKEVGAYIKMRSHYNNSSEVREKLGISEHDTNLGIYIRKLVKTLSE